LREGIDVYDAVRQIEAALTGQEVYSEDPEQDGWWLERLYRATHEPCRIVVRDASALFDALRGRHDLSAIRQTVAARFPHVHRAMPDARQLAEIWKLLSSGGVLSPATATPHRRTCAAFQLSSRPEQGSIALCDHRRTAVVLAQPTATA
jgi:hypothetical protein